MEAEELLMMFIRDGYKNRDGKPSKATAIATMRYVAADPDLQSLINVGDYKAVLAYRKEGEE